MANIKISDMTMKQTAEGFRLSFKEKIELSKLLDKLGVSVIELEGITNPKVDSLRIKSIAAAVKESTVAVPVELNPQSVQEVWRALQLAKAPRLQVPASVSAVQMEYLFHKKPEAMLSAIRQTVADCVVCCKDVEFIAEDATRSDFTFLCQALEEAVASDDKDKAAKYAKILFAQAQLIAGLTLENPSEYADLVCELMK